MVGHLVPLADPLAGVELPVNAEVDSALGILCCRLAERVVAADSRVPMAARTIGRRSMHFVGGQAKGNVIRAVKVAQDPEGGGTEGGVT